MERTKLLIKIVLSVAFAAALFTAVITHALAKMVTSEALDVIITEATEYPPDMAVFLSTIDAIVVINTFWLSLAAIGFCLIFLYYLSGSFQIFLPPAILAIIVFIINQVGLAMMPQYIAIGLESPLEPVLREGMATAQAANYIVLALGIFLLVFSLRYRRK